MSDKSTSGSAPLRDSRLSVNCLVERAGCDIERLESSPPCELLLHQRGRTFSTNLVIRMVEDYV